MCGAPRALRDMAGSEAGGAALPGRLTGGGSTVSVMVATAIVIADMVGVGVFTSIGFQVKDIPSGFSILLLWIIGGIVALCGVFSYSELGAMFPRSSGEYNFLSRAFHPSVGFLAGWVSATVGFAAPVALAAMAFGEYAKSLLPGWPPLGLAIAVVWMVSLVQLSGVRHSSSFQLISTVLKVALIVAFLLAGFIIGTPQAMSFAPSTSDFAHLTSGPFAIGLVFVMYSFSGWNAATYIIGEMRTPQRSLPRALLAGTLIILVLFTRSFEAVLDFIQFALLCCSFLTVLGLIKLRFTQPDVPRPYRAWGYPITPLVFLLVTAFMMYHLLTERPLQSFLGTLIMISGLLIYAVFRKRADPRSATAPTDRG